MDRDHFDKLTRLFATTESRRGALGALLGAAFLGQGVEALAKPNKGKGKGNGKGKSKGNDNSGKGKGHGKTSRAKARGTASTISPRAIPR